LPGAVGEFEGVTGAILVQSVENTRRVLEGIGA